MDIKFEISIKKVYIIPAQDFLWLCVALVAEIAVVVVVVVLSLKPI